MARESWEEVSFQVFEDEDGVLRSGYYPTGEGLVDGNIAVDFVWGNFPLQPNDDRSDTGTSYGGGTGDYGWSEESVYTSDTLRYDDYTVAYNNVGGTSEVPADSHIIVRDEWAGFPGNAVVPNLVGLSSLTDELADALDDANLSLGTITRVDEYSVGRYGITGNRVEEFKEYNRGRVVAQLPVAGDSYIPGETSVNVVVWDTDTTVDVIVPDVVGDLAAAAETAIEALDLVFASTTSTVGATEENDGTVKSQSPAAGTVVNEGATVNVVLYLYEE